MRVHIVARKFVSYLAAFPSLVTAFPFDVDCEYPSVATSASAGYVADGQNVKRQYVYVTTTLPETMTHTSTIYQSVTFYMTYTQYAMRTITMNTVSAAANPLDAAPRPAFTVTQTVTQKSTITGSVQNAGSLAKTSVATIFRTTSVTDPPATITLLRTVFTTSYKTSITGTTTVKVPEIKFLLTDEVNNLMIPRGIATSTHFTVTGSEPAIRRSAPLMGRSVDVTVTETVTPTTSVVITVTITVPGVWIASTIFTGTTTIAAINAAAPNAAAGATETVTVTETDITTVTEAANLVTNTVTQWVTYTALPRLSTTTQTWTITTTCVTDAIYVDYLVST